MKEWWSKPLLLDFDGVIHGYRKGHPFGFEMADPIVYGAADFINDAHKYFDVSIYSARSATAIGRAMMKQYLQNHGIDVQRLGWPVCKPGAWLTIDDRCICFNGRFPTMDELLNFKSWCD